MPVNAGKRHFWEYCPRRYLPANTAGKCHRPTLTQLGNYAVEITQITLESAWIYEIHRFQL